MILSDRLSRLSLLHSTLHSTTQYLGGWDWCNYWNLLQHHELSAQLAVRSIFMMREQGAEDSLSAYCCLLECTNSRWKGTTWLFSPFPLASFLSPSTAPVLPAKRVRNSASQPSQGQHLPVLLLHLSLYIYLFLWRGKDCFVYLLYKSIFLAAEMLLGRPFWPKSFLSSV